jgi:hypothetical protein
MEDEFRMNAGETPAFPGNTSGGREQPAARNFGCENLKLLDLEPLRLFFLFDLELDVFVVSEED